MCHIVTDRTTIILGKIINKTALLKRYLTQKGAKDFIELWQLKKKIKSKGIINNY